MHSGAGRFTVLDMRTMSWHEMGYSTGEISLSRLLNGMRQKTSDAPTDLEILLWLIHFVNCSKHTLG